MTQDLLGRLRFVVLVHSHQSARRPLQAQSAQQAQGLAGVLASDDVDQPQQVKRPEADVG